MTDTAQTPAGRALPLLIQFDYTAGGCAVFARALLQVVGGKPGLLYALDPRQLREHDHPIDMPMCSHAFVIDDDGMAIDAEGRRPIREMARSFGVKRGYRFRVVSDPATLDGEFPEKRPERVAIAVGLLKEHGWEGGVPTADGSLLRNWAEVMRQCKARSGREQLQARRARRLYGLLPDHKMGSWEGIEHLEVRAHQRHGFVVVGVPEDRDAPEALITAAREEEEALELASELGAESGLATLGPQEAFAP